MPLSNTCVIIDEKPRKQNVKICRQCLKNTEIDIKQSGHYKWSTHCFCKNCNFDWFECIHHPTTSYMKTTKQLKKHDIAFHTVTIAKEIVSTSRKRKRIFSPSKYVSIENQK